VQGSVRGISSKDFFACVRLLPVYVKLFCLVMSPSCPRMCTSFACLCYVYYFF
jgi:hypothetical protein